MNIGGKKKNVGSYIHREHEYLQKYKVHILVPHQNQKYMVSMAVL